MNIYRFRTHFGSYACKVIVIVIVIDNCERRKMCNINML